MNELYAILLSWAVVLSGYPTPEVLPIVVTVPHTFFVEKACGGNECRVYGWYAGEDKLYIDKRMNPQESIFHSSIVVHEMVHYLQHQKTHTKPTCLETIAMEHEAYGVQKEFLLRYGVYYPVGISMARVSCED